MTYKLQYIVYGLFREHLSGVLFFMRNNLTPGGGDRVVSDATNRIKAEADYLRGMKYKDVAQKYGVTLNTIKSWKTRYKWDRKSVHTKEKRVHTKGGAPLGNKNAVGNSGGAPLQNTNALKHGLLAKYLPPDTLELVEALQLEGDLGRLKRNIAVLESQIIRAQSIMNVESKEELIKHLKKQTDGDMSSTREWEFQYAWDRQGNFLSSLARAMTTLTGMYKLVAELQPQDPDKGIKEQVGAFVDALTGTASEVWDDEEAEE
jgi:uncharacterized protein YjcR